MTLQTYWTEDAELAIRDLMRRFGRVWVDVSSEVHDGYRLTQRLLNDYTRYRLDSVKREKNAANWVRHGGIMIQRWKVKFEGLPRAPALVLTECPFSRHQLTMRSMNAKDALVVRLPPTWLLHERLVCNLFPAADATIVERLAHHHQRMPDAQAAIASELGYSVRDILALEQAQDPDQRYTVALAKALGLGPKAGPAWCLPCRVVQELTDGTFGFMYEAIRRSPAWREWSLLTSEAFAGTHHHRWSFTLDLMCRKGLLQTRDRIIFFDMREKPDYEAAQAEQSRALEELRKTAMMVAGWAKYPIEDAPEKLRRRRARSPARLAA